MFVISEENIPLKQEQTLVESTWHIHFEYAKPVHVMTTKMSPEEEAFTRDVLDQLHTEKFLPCAAFEEGAKQCRDFKKVLLG